MPVAAAMRAITANWNQRAEQAAEPECSERAGHRPGDDGWGADSEWRQLRPRLPAPAKGGQGGRGAGGQGGRGGVRGKFSRVT